MSKDSVKKAELTEAEKAARRARNASNRARREANAAERAERQQTRAKGKPDAAPAAKSEVTAPAKAKPKAKAKTQSKAEKPAPKRTATPLPADPAAGAAASAPFNILLVVQAGRLEYEAALFVESLRQNAPGWRGRLILAEPQPQAAWAGHETLISPAARALFESRGAEILPFTAQHFGADYPYGNKIEALSVLPAGEPFIFFDSDTLITGPIDRIAFDFTAPSASMQREGTWPIPPLYGPGYGDIWKSLYDRFGLDYTASLDLDQPDEHWERYLYFNAGWFFGADPAEFGRRFLNWALAVRNEPGDALACQELDPWLDQVVLPLVVSSFGGTRPGAALAGLDGQLSCHWRKLPLLYARESDAVVDALERAAAAPDMRALLQGWEPALHLIYQNHGRNDLRPIFDRTRLPLKEQPLRQQIKRAGWWVI